MPEHPTPSPVEVAREHAAALGSLVEEYEDLQRERAWLTRLVVTLLTHTAPGAQITAGMGLRHPNEHIHQLVTAGMSNSPHPVHVTHLIDALNMPKHK